MRETQKSRKQAEQQEAIDRLREILKPGDRVYGIVRTVSRSGMSRTIDFYAFQSQEARRLREEQPAVRQAPIPGLAPTIDRVYLSGHIATALDYRRDKSGALKVQGCGQDMIFHTVYSLGHTLFPDGFGLPCDKCGKPALSLEDASNRAEHGFYYSVGFHHCEFRGRNGDRSGWDTDGGYALKAESL